MSLPGSQSNHDGGRIGQGHLLDNGGPARVRRPLQMKEEEDTAKEAFNRTAFAQFLFGPGGWQTGAVLLSLGIPRNDRHGSQRGVDPVDELKAPIGGIQADDAWTKAIETDGQFQQGAGKGSIMTVGRGDQEMHGQTGAATKQGMHPIAMQEGTGMVGGSMTSGGIGISSAPSQDGSAINGEITSSDQTAAQGLDQAEGIDMQGTSTLGLRLDLSTGV